MQPAPFPVDEPQRLALLRELRLLDPSPEPGFDALTRLLAQLLNVPVALMGVIDERREVFKSRIGFDLTEIRREDTLCSHVLHCDGVFTVADASLDARFAAHPMVVGGPRVRAYAGVALRSAEGHALGTLCAIDHRPRHFSEAELGHLQDLARLARGEILHREAAVRAQAVAVAERARVEAESREVAARRELEARLAETTANLQDLYDNAPCGYYSLDPNGLFLQVNRTALSWMGCRREDAIGLLGSKDFINAEGKALFAREFPRLMQTGSVGPFEMNIFNSDGSHKRVSVSATAVRDANGKFLMSRTVMYDVSDLERVRGELQLLNREQLLMLDNDLIGIVKLRERRCIWKNRAMEQMFGYEPDELDGHPARLLYADDASYETLGAAAYPALARGETYRTQIRMAKKSGEPIWVDLSGTMLSDETDESMWLMLDITAMKQHQEQVERMAFHDPLTGLPNRLLLMNNLEQALAVRERAGGLLALCFIDLDGFKAVNDRLGHHVGDQLLRVMGERLVGAVRGHDTVARLGGDEFVVVLTQLPGRDEGGLVLERVLAAVRLPVAFGSGDSAGVTASIGVAFCPDDGEDAQTLMTRADQAMYRAKQAGRDQIRAD